MASQAARRLHSTKSMVVGFPQFPKKRFLLFIREVRPSNTEHGPLCVHKKLSRAASQGARELYQKLVAGFVPFVGGVL